MTKFIIGQKVGMTHKLSDGKLTPLTAVLAIPNTVIQVKRVDKDGYDAIQLGAGSAKIKKTNKPLSGHYKASKANPQVIREANIDNAKDYKVGDKIEASIFSPGDKVTITGTTKGKGFSGVIKRYGFHRGPETHGSDHHRAPGSIGGGYPERVVKGKKMPGHLGFNTSVMKNAEVIEIIPEENVILIKGSIPGPNKSWITIKN